ncbi:2Fe-2S iron-sulfur cluster-binding protein [Aegicerativicinus sediminis]|uniref:2Fe-2S iron-sulfur cluster-binding protein n=1 Tax=Aegicerativicinus sediminis TaxID=2893202 RepID=UPI001E542AF3|nr:2Fe-2S iron-sulfur cluster-binding protein [Aegicerativicinus sediminis]
MTEFFGVKVKNIHKETADTVVLELDIPEDLKDHLVFQPGQHLTFKKMFDGEEVRRTYSLCTNPYDWEFKVAVKSIPNGIFSTYANNELKVGDTLEIMKPSGRFYVEVNPNKARNYIAFAAGSGITPIISMIKTHLAMEPQSTFKLFYLNSTSKSIIFKEEIEQLKNRYFQRFHVFFFLTREQRDIPFLNGRFDEDKMKLISSKFIDIEDTDHCFLCGPQQMIFLIRDSLVNAGLEKDKIHYELFYSGEADKSFGIEKSIPKVDGTEVTLIDGGKEFHFVMDEENDTILDGGLAAGADLPFACKGGVCSTCKCKLIIGEVTMKVNYALEEDELSKNYILSCQAVPTSKKVVVDFDV